jgi:hypothetical protein
MSERPEIWLLAHGEELIAELVVDRADGPWLHGRVVPRAGFGPLQPDFDRRDVRLIRPNGHELRRFRLDIDGRWARWRGSDKGPSLCRPGEPLRPLFPWRTAVGR